ncbi:MAG: type II CAAX endopeptidase family protein [Bacillota bacterium]
MPVVEFNNRHQKEKEVRTGNMQDKRLLLKAAFLSQVVILLTGLAALWFFYVRQGTRWESIFRLDNAGLVLGCGTLLAAGLVIMQILLVIFVPHDKLLDDGTNKIFYTFSYPTLALLMSFGAFAEELLFRAAMQPGFGIVLTSVLFAVIHVRYLKKWILLLGTFVMSLALGWLYETTQNIWAPVWAHFLVNFVMICFGKNGLFIPKDDSEASQN